MPRRAAQADRSPLLRGRRPRRRGSVGNYDVSRTDCLTMEGNHMRVGSKRSQMMERGSWVWIALIALAGTIVIASQSARADSWHLMLNSVSTVSGTNCPESVTSAMDGTDHVFGNYFGSSGLTFTYRYGDNAPAIT